MTEDEKLKLLFLRYPKANISYNEVLGLIRFEKFEGAGIFDSVSESSLSRILAHLMNEERKDEELREAEAAEAAKKRKRWFGCGFRFKK